MMPKTPIPNKEINLRIKKAASSVKISVTLWRHGTNWEQKYFEVKVLLRYTQIPSFKRIQKNKKNNQMKESAFSRRTIPLFIRQQEQTGTTDGMFWKLSFNGVKASSIDPSAFYGWLWSGQQKSQQVNLSVLYILPSAALSNLKEHFTIFHSSPSPFFS